MADPKDPKTASMPSGTQAAATAPLPLPRPHYSLPPCVCMPLYLIYCAAGPCSACVWTEVVFKIDFSPIMVRITETHLSLLQFLTGLCAIVGGVFTVAGMVDSTVYQSAKILKKTL